MTEEAAIGESQTAEAVAAENKLAAEAMINEGAPVAPLAQAEEQTPPPANGDATTDQPTP